jgi:hypothetical protein
MYERQETVEHNGIKLDVVFDFTQGNRLTNDNNPHYHDTEIGYIRSIKIHDTDIDLTWFLEGEFDSQIEEAIMLELENQG